MTENDSHGSRYKFAVHDIFRFEDGSTVFLGTVDTEYPRLVPADADVQLEGKTVAHIRLTEEPMPGPKSKGHRVVVTRDNIDIGRLKGRECLLVCSR